MSLDVTPSDFEFVRRLVHDHSAIALGEDKEYLVKARLSPIAQREGLGSLEELVGRLRGGSVALCDEVVEAMSTNESSFFRDVHPFEALRNHVIPQVLAVNGGRSLRIWSAAASTGQEPYSLAMLAAEHFPHVDVAILATDLSREVLARAETGCFNQLEVNRGLPAPLLVKYFERLGLRWKVKEQVRRMVAFRRLNLARPFPVLPAMDIVVLRNVLIYFDVATRRAVLDRITRVLHPWGFLCLGTAETTLGLDAAYERVQAGKTMFYRPVTHTPGRR